jgi:hypothetical protein
MTSVAGITIGRVTPAGVVTEFYSGFPNTPRIAAGPDGFLWFTVTGVNLGSLARIPPEGSAIFEFPFLPGNSLPFGITPGPDANMWFTEPNTGKIGRSSVPADVGISPPSGILWSTQVFDLAVIISGPPGVSPLGDRATVNGVDVTAELVACIDGHIDALVGRPGLVARCPGLRPGPGEYDLELQLSFSDGSTVNAGSTWGVLANTEP